MANRYWVGGSGTWDATTTNWSATSGGASGASVPGASDTAVFDQASTYTVTMNLGTTVIQGISNTAGTVTFAGTATSFTMSSFTLTATAVWSSTSTLTFAGTGSFTVDSKNVLMNGNVTFNSVTGAWTLASDFRFASAKIVTLTAGSLDLVSYTLSTPSFIANVANTRTLAFGTGKIVVYGTSAGTIVSINQTALTTSGSKRMEVSRTSGSCTMIISADLNVYVTTGSYSLTFSGINFIGNLDFTGFTGTCTFPSFLTLSGNLTLNTGMTVSSTTSAVTLGGTTGTKTITSNGVVVNAPITISAGAGTWQLVDAMSVGPSLGRTVQLLEGTLNLNNQTLTVGQFISSGTLTRVLAMGTGKVSTPGSFTVTGTISAFSMTGTGTIEFTDTAARTLAGGGYQNYPAVTHTGTGQLTITGSNKFTSLSVTPTTGNTLLFEAGSSNYFVSSFNIAGAAGTLATLGSTTTAQATLRKSGTWFMGANSVDSGNNTGLTFTAGGTLNYLNVSYINGLGPPVTYSSSVTDSATALDATSSIKLIDRAVVDTANASDQPSTVTPFDSSVSESATALDAVSGIGVNNAAVADTATTQDVSTPQLAAVASTSETTTAQDVTASTFAFVRSVTDSATALDASTATTATNASTTDSATAADAITVTETNPASVTESATAQDVGATQLAAVASASETATAQDVTASNFAIPTVITESATALDASASTKTLPSSVVDSATAADATTTLGAFQAALSETVRAQDVVPATQIFVAIVADTAQGSDAVLASFLLASSMSETTRAADATASNIILLVEASVNENARTADATAVVASSFSVSMVEGATAQDLARGTAVFPASFSDGVLVVDASAANYLWALIDDSQTSNWQNASTTQAPGWQDVNDGQTPGWVPVNP